MPVRRRLRFPARRLGKAKRRLRTRRGAKGVGETQTLGAGRILGFTKAPPAPRTWGKESVLCPRSFTTVSEELEVEELISFTISPARRREEEEGAKVISRLLSSLGIRARRPWRLALPLGRRHPRLNGVPSPQWLRLQPALPTKHPKFAPKWHPKPSPGSLAPRRPPSRTQYGAGNAGDSLGAGTAPEKPGSHM